MKDLLLILFLLGTFHSASSQDALTEVKMLAYGNPFDASNANFIRIDNEMARLKQTSLLLFDQWESIAVVAHDSSSFKIDTANYHIQNDMMLFVYEGNMYQLYPEMIQSAVIANREFLSLLYEAKPKVLERGYFEILVYGEYLLLRRHEIELEVTNSNPLGMVFTKEENLVKSESLYYLRSGSSRPQELPRKKSDFIRIFRSNRDDLIDYAKSNHLSQKNTEDVSRIFAYYNGISG